MEQEIQIKKKGSNISSVEWYLVILAIAGVDFVQFLLDLFGGIGLVINRFIDPLVAMSLFLYCWIRGVKMDTKTTLSIGASFLGEEIPGVDIAPLWTLDALAIMYFDKRNRAQSK